METHLRIVDWVVVSVVVGSAAGAPAVGDVTLFKLPERVALLYWDYAATDHVMSRDASIVLLHTDASHGNRVRFWSATAGIVEFYPPEGAGRPKPAAFAHEAILIAWRNLDSGAFDAAWWEPEAGFRPAGDVFQGWQGEPGESDFAHAASEDGSTLVGMRTIGGSFVNSNAMRWTRTGPPDVIGGLPDLPTSAGLDVSSDGGVVLGQSTEQIEGYQIETWIWTPAGGIGAIANPVNGLFVGRRISHDGSVVLGGTVQWDPQLQQGVLLWRDGGVRHFGVPSDAEPYYDYVLGSVLGAGTGDEPIVFGGMGNLSKGAAEKRRNGGYQLFWSDSTGSVQALKYVNRLLGAPAHPVHPQYRLRVVDVQEMASDGRTFEVETGYMDVDGNVVWSASHLLTIPSPLPVLCAGDVDGNGRTDVRDVAVVIQEFGTRVVWGTGGDLNFDGVVDVLDFGVVAAGYGCGE